jgi:hypothetical protein
MAAAVERFFSANRALSTAEIKPLYNAPGNATADRYVAPRSEDILK